MNLEIGRASIRLQQAFSAIVLLLWRTLLIFCFFGKEFLSGMAAAVAPVIENLERSNFISSLSSTREYAERGWGGVELTGYSFPWDRAFEISMEIRLGAFTEPHKALLGIYYK